MKNKKENVKPKVMKNRSKKRKKLTKKKKRIIITITILVALLLIVVAIFRPGKKIEKCWYIKVLRYNRIRKVAYLLGFNNNIRCIETNDEVFGYQEAWGLITT